MADNKLPPSRVPFQLRKTFDPIIQKYFYEISGEKFIFEHLDDGALVLDVGSGAGMLPILLRRTSHEVFAIDLAEFAVTTAKNCSGGHGSFAVAEATSIPFKNNVFDAVIANGLFNRIEDLQPFLDEFSRVVKNDGRVIFNCNNDRTFIPHKQQESQAHHTIDEIERDLSNNSLRLDDIEITFFMSLNQKKLVQSNRMPILIKWFGLWISIFINRIAKQVPWIKERGGHIWICVKPEVPRTNE
jgi:ubiquinone/menaquinone biosynthesis C-methylase UbiE